MSEVKSLEGWSARVDYQLGCLTDFNERRREERNQLAESIGRNRGEIDKRIDLLGTKVTELQGVVRALLAACVVLLASVAWLAVVVLT